MTLNTTHGICVSAPPIPPHLLYPLLYIHARLLSVTPRCRKRGANRCSERRTRCKGRSSILLVARGQGFHERDCGGGGGAAAAAAADGGGGGA